LKVQVFHFLESGKKEKLSSEQTSIPLKSSHHLKKRKLLIKVRKMQKVNPSLLKKMILERLRLLSTPQSQKRKRSS
jgi:uncharacterized protein YdhG (YjbR/CyaY superfamily)